MVAELAGPANEAAWNVTASCGSRIPSTAGRLSLADLARPCGRASLVLVGALGGGAPPGRRRGGRGSWRVRDPARRSVGRPRRGARRPGLQETMRRSRRPSSTPQTAAGPSLRRRARRLARPRRGRRADARGRGARRRASTPRCSTRRRPPASADRGALGMPRRGGRPDGRPAPGATTTCARSRSPTATGSTTSTARAPPSARGSSCRCAPTGRRRHPRRLHARRRARLTRRRARRARAARAPGRPGARERAALQRGARARRPRRAHRPAQPPLLPRDARARGRPRPRYERRLALIVFDLDDFKAINDRIGHLAGDAVLAEAAERMLPVVRAADIACRVGGDEFASSCPSRGRATPSCSPRRIARAIGARPIGKAGQLYLSAGVAELRADDDADDALRARRRGALPREGARQGAHGHRRERALGLAANPAPLQSMRRAVSSRVSSS